MKEISLIIFAYLIGSVSTAIIVCRCMRLPDPRSLGSKNPGATNVMRIGGKKAAAITLLGDAIKGVIPVLLAKYFGLTNYWLASVALVVVIGHVFPIFFGFKGGKGVATSVGAILALSLPLGLALVATWLVIAYVFRYSSVAALVATVMLPIYAFFITKATYCIPLICLSVLVLSCHHENIRNLIQGSETKI